MQISELRKEIGLALEESSDDAIVDDLHRAKAIIEGHGPGGDLRKLCKRKTPALLSLLVGARTNVVTLQVSLTLQVIYRRESQICVGDGR